MWRFRRQAPLLRGVAGLIRKVSASTAAVATTQQSRGEVEQGVSLVKDAGTALNKIVQSVTETVADSDRILDITKSEVATSEQIVTLIESIADINDSNAANAEEVAAAAEEMSATMHTVASGAGETAAFLAAGRGSEVSRSAQAIPSIR